MLQVRLIINTIRRSWWIIAIVTIAAVNLALFLSYRETQLYQTKTKFIVSPNLAMEQADDFMDGVNTVDSVIATYAEILNSRTIRQQAIALLPEEPEDIDDYDFQAVVLPESSVLEMTVIGPDPETAAFLANTMGQEAIQYIQGLYQVYEISVLDPAGVPDDPISPNSKRDAGLAGVLGLVLGSALAVIREQIIVALKG